jgi:diguanylate cyclase
MQFIKQASSILSSFMPCILVGAAGIGMSLTAASLSESHESQHAELQFQVIAENHFMVIQNGLNEYVNRLRAMRALFDSTEDRVTRHEFETFARPLLLQNSAIVTLSWVPRMPQSERAEHERAGSAEGIAGYRIKAMEEDGRLVLSPVQTEYYPIFYATVPLDSPVYGLDLRSEPETLSELEHARDADQLGFSQVRGLVTAAGKQPGFLFSLPVYKHGTSHDSVADRRRNLLGFVHGSLITGRMIDDIIKANKTAKGLDCYFFKPNAAPDDLPVYVHGSRLRKRPAEPLDRVSLTSGWSRDLMADEQPWLTMAVVRMPGSPLFATHERSWLILFFGLIITGAVVTYIRSSRQHASRMMRVNEKVFALAQLDALTSLANRRAFSQRLSEAFAASRRGAKPFAVIYFDLDRFKDVNDTLGHPVGDALLQQVAARVAGAIRKNDLFARFGGDEFAVLQTDVGDPAEAGLLASKIGELIAKPYLIEGNEVHISASIGISRYTAEVAGPDALMIQADLALYRAKQEGRNCYRFHSDDLDQEVQERVMIAAALRGAIERGELELYYQPQVELASRRIIGLEALLRWNHPKYGQLSPSTFIPIAERAGQIQSLGCWVLDAACRQIVSWQDQGLAPDQVAVNVSALHFKSPSELVRDVAASIEKWKIAPKMLEVELTESVLMEVTREHSDQVEGLRRLGVRIAIDDFGTGYSPLHYLANYPIDRVKIARELVSDVATDLRNAAIVRATISLAHELGIQVVAEGIETEGQEEFLLSAGCEYGQGYLFRKPVNADEATTLLRVDKIKHARPSLQLLKNSAA